MKVSEIVKEKRLAMSLKISEIAETLRIKPEYLIAIEDDNAGYFSSQAYYYGYLKQYLKLLEIDINLSNVAVTNSQELAINVPDVDQFYPSRLLVMLSLLCVIFIYMFSSSYLTKENIDPITKILSSAD